MTVYVVRHTHAGQRSKWDGDDRLRPISDLGRAQARALVDVFDGREIDRIISSPLRRCVQSVEPLAADRNLEVEEDERLAEATPRPLVRELLSEVGHERAILCSHGDVIGDLIGELRIKGVPLPPDPAWAKGSVWLLEFDSDGRITDTDYVPAPKVQMQ